MAIPAGVSAQAPGSDPIAAEKLFSEARKLLDAGKYAEACQKLADSQKLDPAVGTLLNLAQCYEKLGRTASAWSTYREAAAAARTAGQADREKKANRAAQTLESDLPKLTVTVPEAAVAKGVEVKRNGSGLPSSLWGVAVPVDPGEYVIEAHAPGKKAWSARVKAEPGRATAVILPPLDEAETPPSATPASTSPASPGASSTYQGSESTLDARPSGLRGQRVAALVVAGAGVVAGGVGAGFAFCANASYNDSTPYCKGNFCSQPGLDARDDAFQKGRVATALVTGGALAFVAGAVLWVTAPSARAETGGAPRVRVSAGVLPGVGSGAVTVNGIW